MKSRKLINLVSVDADVGMRLNFGRSVPGRDDATVMNARNIGSVHIPRITVTSQVGLSEYTHSTYQAAEHATMIFIFNADTHVGKEHIRLLALANYTVEVSGINPGGMRIERNYFHAHPDDFEEVWREIFRLEKITRQKYIVDDIPVEEAQDTVISPPVCGRPVVGHWG